MSEKKADPQKGLDPHEVEVETFVVEELEHVAGGVITPIETQDANCGTCTCVCG